MRYVYRTSSPNCYCLFCEIRVCPCGVWCPTSRLSRLSKCRKARSWVQSNELYISVHEAVSRSEQRKARIWRQNISAKILEWYHSDTSVLNDAKTWTRNFIYPQLPSFLTRGWLQSLDCSLHSRNFLRMLLGNSIMGLCLFRFHCFVFWRPETIISDSLRLPHCVREILYDSCE